MFIKTILLHNTMPSLRNAITHYCHVSPYHMNNHSYDSISLYANPANLSTLIKLTVIEGQKASF